MQECVLCEEYITNPLCPTCISEQVIDWLGERMPNLVKEFKQESVSLSLGLFNNNSCIKCKGFMDICTYCYTEHVLEWLQSKNVSEDLISEFLRFFHFDLERKGYSKNLELN